jgi:UDP-N-acetylglucosamine 3-dehydrogenase
MTPPTPAHLRAAVVGVGEMGKNHARVYSELETIDLVGVADPDPAVRDLVAARCHTRGYADYRKLVEVEKPDVVSLVVPTRHHYAIACDLIEHGIHVLVEKPITETMEQGRALIRQAQARGVKLGVGHVERFNPAVIALKEHLDGGELGTPFQVAVRRIGGFPPRVRDIGVVLDLATHDLDVMRYLIGGQVVRVSAEITCASNSSREDILCGLLRFDDGVIGLLDVNWLSPTKIRSLTVNGQSGMFVVNYLSQDLEFYENVNARGTWESLQVFRGVAEGRMIRYPISRREPLSLELQAFARSVLHDEPFPVSGADGLEALMLAMCLVQAGQENRSIVPAEVL